MDTINKVFSVWLDPLNAVILFVLCKVRCFTACIQTVFIYNEKMDKQGKTNQKWKLLLMFCLGVRVTNILGGFMWSRSLGLLYYFLGHCRKWLSIFSLKCSEWMMSVFQSFPFCLDLSLCSGMTRNDLENSKVSNSIDFVLLQWPRKCYFSLKDWVVFFPYK